MCSAALPVVVTDVKRFTARLCLEKNLVRVIENFWQLYCTYCMYRIHNYAVHISEALSCNLDLVVLQHIFYTQQWHWRGDGIKKGKEEELNKPWRLTERLYIRMKAFSCLLLPYPFAPGVQKTRQSPSPNWVVCSRHSPSGLSRWQTMAVFQQRNR